MALLKAAEAGDMASTTQAMDKIDKVTPNFDVNVKDHLTGCTPLHAACAGGNPAVIQFLINRKADPAVCASALATPLHHAATNGKHKAAAFLINVCSKQSEAWSVDVKDVNGCTPLHAAAARGHIKVVDVLIGAGAQVEVGNFCGATALHYAASHGQKTVVTRLLRRGVDVGVTDQNGCTGLHVAAFYGQDSVAKLLLDAGANKDVIDVFGMTPLDTASKCGNVAVCSLLEGNTGVCHFSLFPFNGAQYPRAHLQPHCPVGSAFFAFFFTDVFGMTSPCLFTVRPT